MDGNTDLAFALPATLDLLCAESLCRELRTKILSGESILLDGRMVDRVSTPCVQILTATLKSAQSRGLSFRLEAPSKALTESFADLGLSELFAGSGA